MATLGQLRYARCSMVVMDVFPQIMQDLMIDSNVSPESIYNKIIKNKTFMKKLKSKEIHSVHTLLTDGFTKLNVSLIYKIVKFFKIYVPEPSRKWGSNPQLNEIEIGDDVERIRIARNALVQKPKADISEEEMDNFFTMFTDVGRRVDQYLNKEGPNRFEQTIQNYSELFLDEEMAEQHLQVIRDTESFKEECTFEAGQKKVHIYIGKAINLREHNRHAKDRHIAVGDLTESHIYQEEMPKENHTELVNSIHNAATDVCSRIDSIKVVSSTMSIDRPEIKIHLSRHISPWTLDFRTHELKEDSKFQESVSLSTNEPIASEDLSRKCDVNLPISITDKDTIDFKDFEGTSRYYDGYFIDCITHNESRNILEAKTDFGNMSRYYNGYFVDCISQNKSRNIVEVKTAEPISFKQLLDAKDIPEYTILAYVKTHIRPGTSLPTALSENLILCAIERHNSMLCRLILGFYKHLNVSIQIYLHALQKAIENSEKDSAKAIAWFVTRLFVRCHVHSVDSIRDIWPAVVCNCCKQNSNENKIFCSKKICIVIESNCENVNLPIFPTMFNIEIKILPHKYKNETEAEFITNRIKYIKHISLSKEMSVTGDVAELLFHKHSKLTIISNSLYKSKGYRGKDNREVVEGPCIQLYCRAKGLIPIGEEHFPQNLCGLPTDIVEGHSSLMCNIRIGDMVGRNGKVGTLGGFVKVRGDLAFLTCCHVITDAESLAPVNISFDDETPVWINFFPWLKMQDGNYARNNSYVCGRIREAPAFETDNSERVSLDAVLVTIEQTVCIDKNNLLSTKDDQKHPSTFLGLKTEFLNENCIDYNQFCYGNPKPQVNVVFNGAISGIFRGSAEMGKDMEGISIDLQSFKDSSVEVIREGKQKFISWIKEFLTMTDSEDDMPIDLGKFIEEKCGIHTSSETKSDITDVIKRVVDQLRANANLSNDIGQLLEDAARSLVPTNSATLFGGTHIQTHFLAKTADMRDIRRLSRRMYNQIYISNIPFQSGDSGTCIYVKEPHISGCVGMAIADHPGGGCIATPIMEILKHFKIRIKS